MNETGLELSTRHLYPIEGFSRPPIACRDTPAPRAASSVRAGAPISVRGVFAHLADWAAAIGQVFHWHGQRTAHHH